MGKTLEKTPFWLLLGAQLVKRTALSTSAFRQWFKLTPVLVQYLWKRLEGHSARPTAEELLLTLYFLKSSIQNTTDLATNVHTTRKTLLLKVARTVRILIESLPPFDFDSRFQQWPHLRPSCLCDTTFCRIRQPYLSPWEYFRKEKKDFALLYQVVVSLGKPFRILSFEGPFKGSAADVSIFRSTIKPQLLEEEYVMCDKGYFQEEKCWCPPTGFIQGLSDEQKFHRRAVTRIRQLNERLIGR